MIGFIILVGCFHLSYSNKIAGICDKMSPNNWTLIDLNRTALIQSNVFSINSSSATLEKCLTDCCSNKGNFFYF